MVEAAGSTVTNASTTPFFRAVIAGPPLPTATVWAAAGSIPFFLNRYLTISSVEDPADVIPILRLARSLMDFASGWDLPANITRPGYRSQVAIISMLLPRGWCRA